MSGRIRALERKLPRSWSSYAWPDAVERYLFGVLLAGGETYARVRGKAISRAALAELENDVDRALDTLGAPGVRFLLAIREAGNRAAEAGRAATLAEYQAAVAAAATENIAAAAGVSLTDAVELLKPAGTLTTDESVLTMAALGGAEIALLSATNGAPPAWAKS